MYISRTEHKWIMKTNMLAVNIAMSDIVYYKLYILLVVAFTTMVFKSPLLSSTIFTCLPLMGMLVEGFIWRMVLYQSQVTSELLVTCHRLAVNIRTPDVQFLQNTETQVTL